MADLETAYDRDNVNKRRDAEILGPAQHITSTIGKAKTSYMGANGGDMMSGGEQVVAELLDHEFNVSGNPYPGVDVPRHSIRRGHGMLEGRIATAGVDPLANLEQPEGKFIGGQPQMEVQAAEDEMFAAATRWHRRTARHRPDPNHPANQ